MVWLRGILFDVGSSVMSLQGVKQHPRRATRCLTCSRGLKPSRAGHFQVAFVDTNRPKYGIFRTGASSLPYCKPRLFGSTILHEACLRALPANSYVLYPV